MPRKVAPSAWTTASRPRNLSGMGSTPGWSTTFAGCLLGAFVLHVAAQPPIALAQHADAGVGPKATAPRPPEGRALTPEARLSGALPKLIDPAQLSESVRARLSERAAGRHASDLPEREPALGGGPVPLVRSRASRDPLRRGMARMRRVQAVETAEGVTLLSNRIHPLPEPLLESTLERRPEPEAPNPPEGPAREALAAAAGAASERPNATETRSLRPSASRSVAPKGTGLGSLLWPFVLFVTAGAVVSTLWLNKRAE